MNEKRIYELFQGTLFIKGLLAVLEIIGGILAYFISPATIMSAVGLLTQDELGDDPHDAIANYLLQSAHHIAVGGTTFMALYLLSHGIVKLALVVGLLRNSHWAYPASLVVLAFFIVYQMYRFTFTHSIGLVLLSIFDLAIIALIWHEYRLVREHLRTQRALE